MIGTIHVTEGLDVYHHFKYVKKKLNYLKLLIMK